jgi:3-phenylpropionate/trans-cinnamate dioxygenase ferredoxin reductase subunit
MSASVADWVVACSVDDIEEEDVLRFDHEGRTYAIYRSPDGDFFATDGLCTHESVHLADGLVMDNIIECPKHNGRFDYRTGEAGARAAAALRENGWTGPVTLVGDEAHPPYERPPLSKTVMQDAAEPVPATILTAERLDALGITLFSGRRAVRIDRAAHAVTLDDGRTLPYEKLLLTTGASPRRLPVPGAGSDHVLYLRNFTDALALRARLGSSGHLLLIGGGFIGLEIAASARARGMTVTLLEGAPRILQRGVPEAAAQRIAARHVEAGVRIVTDARITAIEDVGGRQAVLLGDGSRIEADAVVAGIGAVPNTELAEASGLAVANGIAVDATLCTNDPDIFAAGDCCSFPHPLYGGRRIRLEAWRNAQDQGTVAGRNMLGHGEAYAAVPWFWSDQYELCLQTAGLADGTHRLVTRDLGDGAALWFHLDAQGRLICASGVGPIGKVAREIRLAEMLIAGRARPDPDNLAVTGVKLKTLLRAA